MNKCLPAGLLESDCMSKLPKIAFISTGGTIASIGATTRELQDYGANGVMLQAADLVTRVPELAEIADVIAVPIGAGAPLQLRAQQD